MASALLIVHAIVGAALLGAITHQLVAALRQPAASHPALNQPVFSQPATSQRNAAGRSFLRRYASVDQTAFPRAVMALYVTQVILGAVIYPAYRLNVRIPFEEMSLGWAIGVFELKEHFAGLGLVALPFYLQSWRSPQSHPRDRLGITVLLAFITWWDFLIGHILNNLRGLA